VRDEETRIRIPYIYPLITYVRTRVCQVFEDLDFSQKSRPTTIERKEHTGVPVSLDTHLLFHLMKIKSNQIKSNEKVPLSLQCRLRGYKVKAKVILYPTKPKVR